MRFSLSKTLRMERERCFEHIQRIVDFHPQNIRSTKLSRKVGLSLETLLIQEVSAERTNNVTTVLQLVQELAFREDNAVTLTNLCFVERIGTVIKQFSSDVKKLERLFSEIFHTLQTLSSNDEAKKQMGKVVLVDVVKMFQAKNQEMSSTLILKCLETINVIVARSPANFEIIRSLPTLSSFTQSLFSLIASAPIFPIKSVCVEVLYRLVRKDAREKIDEMTGNAEISRLFLSIKAKTFAQDIRTVVTSVVQHHSTTTSSASLPSMISVKTNKITMHQTVCITEWVDFAETAISFWCQIGDSESQELVILPYKCVVGYQEGEGKIILSVSLDDFLGEMPSSVHPSGPCGSILSISIDTSTTNPPGQGEVARFLQEKVSGDVISRDLRETRNDEEREERPALSSEVGSPSQGPGDLPHLHLDQDKDEEMKDPKEKANEKEKDLKEERESPSTPFTPFQKSSKATILLDDLSLLPVPETLPSDLPPPRHHNHHQAPPPSGPSSFFPSLDSPSPVLFPKHEKRSPRGKEDTKMRRGERMSSGGGEAIASASTALQRALTSQIEDNQEKVNEAMEKFQRETRERMDQHRREIRGEVQEVQGRMKRRIDEIGKVAEVEAKRFKQAVLSFRQEIALHNSSVQSIFRDIDSLKSHRRSCFDLIESKAMEETVRMEEEVQRGLEEVREVARKAAQTNNSIYSILRSLEAVDCVDLSL